jgi:hypothetical protein
MENSEETATLCKKGDEVHMLTLSIFPLSMILRLDFITVTTVWYFQSTPFYCSHINAS